VFFFDVDLGIALGGGVKCFRSEDGVVLSGGEKEVYLGKEYFEKVGSRRGKVLWPLKDTRSRIDR
jgi:hypothetical protein